MITKQKNCFDNGYVGKQPVSWKEYCEEYWLKEYQESMDRCPGPRYITELPLKTALNTIHSVIRCLQKGISHGASKVVIV